MEHTVEIEYDRGLVRRALNCFMLKRLGWPVLITIIALGIFLLTQYLNGSWSGGDTALLVAWLVTVGLLGLVYQARFKASEGFFAKSKVCVVKFVFSEEGVRTTSELGSSELRWEIFDEVLKFDDLWLLVYVKSGYMTLPSEKLTEQIKNLIDRKILMKGTRR